jgi:FMN-dependent oxidoreductase (nitrilotriacetate monooxygenase family)
VNVGRKPLVPDRQLHFNLNAFSTGVYPGSWLLPDALDDAFYNIEHYRNLARTIERGKFDAFFLADAPALSAEIGPRPPFGHGFDPIVLLSAIAGSTTHLGLIATCSTTYNAPYDLARRLASLDHVSGGRAGWNAVTTVNAEVAANFGGQPHPPKESRYRRAGEFIEVVRKLWDSWDDDAVIADRTARQYVRPGSVRDIDHVGEHFSVRGPLTIPRSPQGQPVIFQAGGSPQGRDLAAREADGIFAFGLEREASVDYVNDIRQRAQAYGRDFSKITILPGLVTIIGGTEAEARARQNELNELAGGGPSIVRLASWLQIDPNALSLDRPVPPELLPEDPEAVVNGSYGSQSAIAKIARSGLTVREILQKGGGGHRLLVGSPEQIADDIQEWFETGAADGFNLMPSAVPSDLEAFVDHVIPILQQRGLFRTEYTGTTLRDHLGLTRPEPRSHVSAAASA